jgi:urease beta subunit
MKSTRKKRASTRKKLSARKAVRFKPGKELGLVRRLR